MTKKVAKTKLPSINDPVTRSFNVSNLRAVVGSTEEEKDYIDGHAAVYSERANIYEMFYEVIEPGAFTGANFDDVLLCVNHDTKKIPLARSRRNNGKSTMHITPDNKGLHIRADLDTDRNVDAKALYSSVDRGDIDGMSLIFYVQEERWEDMDKDMPVRYITKVKKVREVTAASFPFYEGTDINARDQSALDNAAMVLDNARSTLDNEKNEPKEEERSDQSQQEIEVLKLRAKIKFKKEPTKS